MDTAIWGYPDPSTCKWSLPWEVGVVNSISTKGAGLPSTHAMWHFLLEKSWNFRPQSTGERLLLLRNSAIQHSRDFMPKLNVSAVWEYIKIEQVSLSCSRTVDYEKWGLHREIVRSQLKPWVSRWHHESWEVCYYQSGRHIHLYLFYSIYGSFVWLWGGHLRQIRDLFRETLFYSLQAIKLRWVLIRTSPWPLYIYMLHS